MLPNLLPNAFVAENIEDEVTTVSLAVLCCPGKPLFMMVLIRTCDRCRWQMRLLRACPGAQVIVALPGRVMSVLIVHRRGRSTVPMEHLANACLYQLNGFCLTDLLSRQSFGLGVRKWWSFVRLGCLGPCLLFHSLALTPTCLYITSEQKSWIPLLL
jgi:hypothetical protein